MKREVVLTLAGIMLGAVGGYLYYHFVGCQSGNCPITSKPLNSTLYGSVMGALLFHSFLPAGKKRVE